MKISTRDLVPDVFAVPARIAEVREHGTGAVVGHMLVDDRGMNCVRHQRDRFPLIMDREGADGLMAECARRMRWSANTSQAEINAWNKQKA